MDSAHFTRICEEAYVPFSSILFLSDSFWFADFMALNLLDTEAQAPIAEHQESSPASGSSKRDLTQKLEMLVFSVLKLND